MSYAPAAIELEVDAAQAGLVVLTDTYYPGWHAAVDGRAAPLLRTNLLFRGVPVASGSHRVFLWFDPLSVKVGGAVSALALAANGAFILTGIPAPRPAIDFDASGLMRDFVLQNQLMFGTVNAGRKSYEAAVRMLEQFLLLFPDAARRVIARRIALDEAPASLRAAGGGAKTVIDIAAAGTAMRDEGLRAAG